MARPLTEEAQAKLNRRRQTELDSAQYSLLPHPAAGEDVQARDSALRSEFDWLLSEESRV